MGIDSFGLTLKEHLGKNNDNFGSIPPELLEHDEPVDRCDDAMTRLVYVCRNLANECPQGVTTRMLYERYMRTFYDMLGRTRYRFAHCQKIQHIVICFDKKPFVPPQKARKQKDHAKDIIPLDDSMMWSFDDFGIYSTVRHAMDEKEPNTSAPFHPMQVIFTRSVRLELFRYFWRTMQKDPQLWTLLHVDETDERFGIQAVGPRLRYVVDFELDDLGAHVMDIAANGSRTFTRLPRSNYIGEGETCVIWHLLRLWTELECGRISIFSVDGDMMAMLCLHFWFYDCSALRSFLWHRSDAAEHVGFHIPHLIAEFRARNWNRDMLCVLWALHGTDYCDKWPGVGVFFALDAIKLMQQGPVQSIPLEVPQWPDVMRPVSEVRFNTVLLEMLKLKFSKSKKTDELRQQIAADKGQLYHNYVWQFFYWARLYAPSLQ